MAISELVAIVRAPQQALETDNGNVWTRVVEDIGLTLPGDLREFGERYGSGRFCGGFIQVFNPLSVHYRKFIDHECNLLRKIASDIVPIEFAIYADRPGLFPWGRDEHGHRMYWLTEGLPEHWPIILRTRECEFERWEMPITTFLAKALSNEIKCLLWQTPFSKKQRVFNPGMT